MSSNSREREFTGWHMLAVMVGFFGVIVGVNFIMAFSAISSWTGLVVENSYVASQEFNEKLANSRAQAALGWSIDLHYADGELRFGLTDADGGPVEADNVEVALRRPIGISEDRTLGLQPTGAGAWAVREALPDGVWNVEVTAEVAELPAFLYRARLLVDPE